MRTKYELRPTLDDAAMPITIEEYLLFTPDIRLTEKHLTRINELFTPDTDGRYLVGELMGIFGPPTADQYYA